MALRAQFQILVLALHQQSWTTYLRQPLVFFLLLREKFNFCFSGVLTKFSIWEEDQALGYNSMKFEDFSDIS